MTTNIAPEADWDLAPHVLAGARDLRLSPEQCDLDYWITNVAQGTLKGLVNGHHPDAVTPEHMLKPGPLRDALLMEFSFRSIAEDKAARAITQLVTAAPDEKSMQFFATQLLDEARHAQAFRAHMVEVGVPEADLADVVAEFAGEHQKNVLDPLEEFGLSVMDGPHAYVSGVAVLTILVEGVLAPTGELSEHKWKIVDPAAASVERGAGIDEIRHLTVGSEIVRRYVAQDPTVKEHLADVVRRGNELWAKLPVFAVLQRREELFQAGIEQIADFIGDHEIWPGRRLLDSTPDERITKALEWAAETQTTRLAYMGMDS
ncbi:VlmB-like protein [Streptomyces graminofaciens]|uniref:VlmB-like protein n=1 Tax=Streptomyces graminofaciens TaxID=68212 RepID=A0ABN5VEK9_9ACTN|nr:VlmB-like protein [Streptomyces graminofaciens]BBC31501.1 VlmB-like protein [Streptomyces graminofaciens]